MRFTSRGSPHASLGTGSPQIRVDAAADQPSPLPEAGGAKKKIRQMTSFYDEKDLEEELSRVGCPDEDLDFEYLFEYEPPGSDVAGPGQGLSDAFWQPEFVFWFFFVFF